MSSLISLSETEEWNLFSPVLASPSLYRTRIKESPFSYFGVAAVISPHLATFYRPVVWLITGIAQIAYSIVRNLSNQGRLEELGFIIKQK